LLSPDAKNITSWVFYTSGYPFPIIVRLAGSLRYPNDPSVIVFGRLAFFKMNRGSSVSTVMGQILFVRRFYRLSTQVIRLNLHQQDKPKDLRREGKAYW
jgi:hypothetical protein